MTTVITHLYIFNEMGTTYFDVKNVRTRYFIYYIFSLTIYDC